MMTTWEDCEPTVENFWKNVKTVDPLMDLSLTAMILGGYYLLPGNKDKNYRDLELELRENDINLGLIACNSEKDEDLKRAIEDKRVVLIKKQYQNLYKNIPNHECINPDHITKYSAIYSCRPRKYVINETLEHSKSIEENLEKLKDAGDIITHNDNPSIISESDRILSTEEQSLSSLVQNGKKLLKVTKVDLSEIIQKTHEENPDATFAIHSMAYDGSPIFALVKQGQIICQVGMKISLDTDGNKVMSYLPLPR